MERTLSWHIQRRAKVFEIFSLPVSVFGASMATYCGQNYGAGKYDRIRQGLKAVLGIGCVFSVIIFILSHTISPYLISFIASSKNKEVIYWGTQYLVYDMSFQVVCVFIVILRNSLQGIGDQRTPVFSSFIELAGKVVFTLVLCVGLVIGQSSGQNRSYGSAW